MSLLPNEYIQLDWIESTTPDESAKGQAIDTGLYALDNDVIEIRGKFTDTKSGQFVCGTHNSGNYRKVICIFDGSGTSQPMFTASAGSWNEVYPPSGNVWEHNGKPLVAADTNIHTFLFDQAGNTLTIDSTTYTLTNYTGRKAPGVLRHMPLFANYHDTEVPGSFARFRMEYAKFTQSGVLVRHFIPALRKSDKKPGLYDIVNNVFYTNIGTGDDFQYPLPNTQTYIYDKYVPLEWLKTKGQYTDIGAISGKVKIEFDGIMNPQIDPPGSYDGIMDIVGTQNYGGSSTSAIMMCMGCNQHNNIVLRINGSWPYVGEDIYAYERHKVVLEQLASSTILSVDGTQKITINNLLDVSNKPLFVGGGYRHAATTFYSVKVYSNNTLVRDLIPVYNVVTKQFGMLDKLNDVFYPFNSNTGITYERKSIDEDDYVIDNYKTIVSNHTNYKSFVVIGDE